MLEELRAEGFGGSLLGVLKGCAVYDTISEQGRSQLKVSQGSGLSDLDSASPAKVLSVNCVLEDLRAEGLGG